MGMPNVLLLFTWRQTGQGLCFAAYKISFDDGCHGPFVSVVEEVS